MEDPQEPLLTHAFGPYRLSTAERVLRYNGEPVILASKALEVLCILIAGPDRVVSKTELMDRVWPAAYVDESNLTQNIYLLRKLFKQHQSGVRIENIPKQGYRLVLPEVTPTVPTRSLRLAICAIFAACILTLSIGVAMRLRNGAPSRPLEGETLRTYMLAQNLQNTGLPKDLERSITLFSSVVRSEPASALGYAGLAESDASLSYYTPDEVRRVRLQADALSFARQAVRTDPASPDAYASLGGAEFSIEHDARSAGAHLERAIALNPRQVNALVWYGTLLLSEGRIESARRTLTRAVGLAPNSSGTVASLAWSDFIAADYPAAIELSKQQLLGSEQPMLAHLTLANAYIRSHDYRQASKIIAIVLRDQRTHVQGQALSAQLQAAMGNLNTAARELQALDGSANPRLIDSWDAASIAAAYVSLGNRAQAFIWLARVPPWERGEIRRDPRFAVLADDRTFLRWADG